jgi:protein-disulfide isomerase
MTNRATLVVPVSKRDHIQGDINAPVTLVEYGDFECPHCVAAHPIVKQLQGHFGDRLAFVFRHFPLTEIHENARFAAEATEVAAKHGKFWEMHDAILERKGDLKLKSLFELASNLRLSILELATDLTAHTYTARVNGDIAGGDNGGVHGTPTFFINGQHYRGPWDYTEIVAAIEAIMPADALAYAEA